MVFMIGRQSPLALVLAFAVFALRLKSAAAGVPCCSQNFRTCLTGTPKSQAACAADRGNLVWLAEGGINTTCIERGKSTTCTKHEDCCATLVCDGVSSSHRDKRCYHPIDLCATYKDEPFCKTRSSCMWNVTRCIPNFNFTVNLPENKPKNIPDDPGCCSVNHLECSRTAPKTWEQCKTTQDGTYVWIPQGNRTVPNPNTCLPRGNTTDCTKHDDCCGSLICAPASPWNALKLLCRPPLEACSDGNPTKQFCNNVPGCAWSNNKCVPAFDYTVVNPAAKGVLPGPRIVKTADNGNPDFLGLCKGYVGTVWGDPHFVTFDRRKFDCQATGAFTLVKAECQIEIQGMFHKRNASMFPSVLVGVAIAYPDIPTVPKIQLNIAEYDAGPNKTIALGGKCGGHLYIDGVLQTAKRGDAILGDGYVIIINKSGGVDIQYFNGDLASSSIRITTGGEPDKSFGCLMTLMVCLPFNEPDLLQETVGLLGTPNGNTTDEWTTPTGSVIGFQQNGKVAYDFCTSNYCVASQRSSLFVYETISHKARYSCSREYPGDVDLSNPPDQILEICGADNADCLLEGVTGGVDRAVESQQIEKKISDIAASPKLITDAKFNLPIQCGDRPVGGGNCATADGLCVEIAGKCEIVGPIIGPPVETSVRPTPAPVTQTLAPVCPTLSQLRPTPAPVTPTPAPVTPTPGPTAGPTAGPSGGPTAGPSTGPSAGPSAGPSSGPTAGPSSGPSTPICPYPTPVSSACPSDVVQMDDVNTELPFNPFTIISQDHENVTFTVFNPFGEDVLSVYYQYSTATTGEARCYSESPFASCSEPIKVTAHCLTGLSTPLTIVDVWFVDPTVIDSGDTMTIPKCCKHEETPTPIPTVQYTFKVYCESKCVESSGRTLSGYAKAVSKSADEFERVARDDGISFDLPHEGNPAEGHFCSSVDHPCGENGKMVNVCHYSSKDGYQTYCVPELDSDVIAYVPKDYCGPCVGGYQRTTYRH